MKSGTAWSLRGLDEDAREAAAEAARQAGLSVSEWLNQTIAERAAEEGVALRADDEGDNQLHAVAESVQKLTRRIRAMDQNSRAAISGLKDRLDEIGGNLGRVGQAGAGDARRTRSLDGVSAMVDQLAREIDDADESARSTIEGLRARVGASERSRHGEREPGDQIGAAIRALDQRIADMAERLQRPPPAPERSHKLDDLRQRLEGLLARSPEPARPTAGEAAAALDSTLRGLERRIDEAKARTAPPVELRAPAAAVEDERLRRLEANLAQITGRLAEPPSGRTATTPATGRADDLTASIAEIAARQKALDERDEARAMRMGQKAIADSIATLRSDVAGLIARVAQLGSTGAEDQTAWFGIARRIDALAAEAPVDHGLLAGIRGELDAIRAISESTAREETVVARIDELARAIPDHGRLDALGEEISEVRRALESADGPRAMSRLEMRVNELARGVEAALNSRQAATDTAAAGMAAGLADIRHALEELGEKPDPADAVISGLSGSLIGIRTAIDDLVVAGRRADPADDAVTERLEARLDQIASRIDGVLDLAAPADVVNGLHDRLELLVERLDQISLRPAQPVRVDHLEDQIRDLAGRLERASRPDADAGQIGELEARVARLAAQLESAGPGGRAVDSDLLRSLRGDLDRIRAASGDTDQRNQETLSALHGMLASVVDRLAKLERAERDEIAAAAATETLSEEPVIPRAEPASLPRIVARRAAEPAPSPDAVKPDVAPRREPAAGASASGRERTAGDRRADFIAAARRAAQAAVAEAGSAEKAERAPDPRPSAFARIGQAIRTRKKPLLLAAAAIVLAIGAMQVFGPWLGEEEGGVAVARIEPPAVEAPVEPAPLAAAEPPAPIVPKVARTALVAPAADARTALAGPGSIASRFGDGFEKPATGGFAPAEDAQPIEATAVAAETPVAAAPAGDSVSPTPASAIGSDKLRAAASAGDPAAAFEIATRYAEGRGVTQNLSTAAEWYARAAERGVAVAQYRLGSLYERGQGLKKDLTAAVNWYQRAADQGNVGAMHNLAVLMSEGVDGPPDAAKALEWFLAAGNYGVKDSQYNLGVIYARGLGPERDLVELYKWFAVAAAQGDTDAAARRDEVGGLLPPDQLAKARAIVQAWRAKPPLPEANGVSTPDGGWDASDDGITEADRSQLVKKIQALLTDQGYDPGPADGVDGPKTREAVRAFQRTLGMPETGQIDGTLVTALAEKN